MAQINANSQAAADRDYADFEPSSQWVREEASDTFIVKLPGFRRNELTIQVTSAPLLRISGERQIELNTYTRFKIEFPIPPTYDTNGITAKFERGQLQVKIPKLVTPAAQEVPSKPREEKEESKGDEVISQKEKEQPSDQAADDNKEDAKKKKVRTDGPVETVEAPGTSSKPNNEQTDTSGASRVVKRVKTHILDWSESLRQVGADDDQDKKELAAPAGRQSNKKKLLNLVVAILMFVVLGLYVKNAFKSITGGFKSQEL